MAEDGTRDGARRRREATAIDGRLPADVLRSLAAEDDAKDAAEDEDEAAEGPGKDASEAPGTSS